MPIIFKITFLKILNAITKNSQHCLYFWLLEGSINIFSYSSLKYQVYHRQHVISYIMKKYMTTQYIKMDITIRNRGYASQIQGCPHPSYLKSKKALFCTGSHLHS